MSAQLGERLRELADDAPDALHSPDLWAAGRSRHRRRIVTAVAVVAAVVALTAGVGLSDWRSRQPAPAAPPATDSGPMAIPDRFYAPSPWLPSTRTPGRLVAIMPSVEQHHVFGGPTEGVVGVAAGSQRYTFLDLPDHSRAYVSDVNLAPDGRHLAYAYNGPVPHSSSQESNAYGIAILDLTTGHMLRRDLPTPYGFNNVAFRWATPSTLVVNVTAMFDAANGHPGGVVRGIDLSCSVEDEQCRHASHYLSAQDTDTVSGGSGYAYLASDKIVVADPLTGVERSSINVRPPLYWGAALSPDGSRVTAQLGSSFPSPLGTGVVRKGRVTLHRIAGTSRYTVVGMPDDRHVLANHNWPLDRLLLESVDVLTGRRTTLSRYAMPTVVAGDALSAPHVVTAVAPQRPWNRRTELWCLVGGLLAIGGIGARAMVRGRSRVRR